MQYETEDDRIHGRVQLVAAILDDLQETTHRRRSAILAVADVVYDPEVRVDVYAKPLMVLEDDTLEGLRSAASFARAVHPMPRPENSIPEQDRVRYLNEIREIAQAVDSDDELMPADRKHVTDLVRQLADALEAAPVAGEQSVVTAAKAIVGDSQLAPELWRKVARKKWARKLAAIVVGILALVGNYSSAKELTQDVATLLHQVPAIAASQHPPQSSEQDSGEVHDAEIIEDPEDSD